MDTTEPTTPPPTGDDPAYDPGLDPVFTPGLDPVFDIGAIERPHPNLLKQYAISSLVGLIVAPIIFLPLLFKYYTLRYKFDEEGVSARWGILFRREIYLTYKRIQDIHVKRNVVERWLGIGTVEVQTASGSSSAELSLEGMEHHASVRDYLYGRMRGFARGGTAAQTQDHASQQAPGTTGGGATDGDVVELLQEIRTELEGVRRELARR
jgi:putative membrane protein